MKYTITGLVFSVVILINCFSFKQTYNNQMNKNTATKLIQVKDSLYYIKGHGGNIGVLIGGDGVLLVDDQFAYSHSDIKANLSTISNLDVKYVINTHWHVDHTNGNEKFGASGSMLIAQKNSQERMSSNQYIQVFNHHQKAYSKKGIPQLSFTNSMEMNCNQQSIQLISMNHAHTDGDLIVVFKEANVIHTGDIFVTYGYPFIDEPNGGTIQGVIKAIDQIILLADEETKIIPGHGEISTKQDLISYNKMLKIILQKISYQVRSGKSYQEILASHPTEGYSSEKINEAIFTQIVFNNLKTL